MSAPTVSIISELSMFLGLSQSPRKYAFIVKPALKKENILGTKIGQNWIPGTEQLNSLTEIFFEFCLVEFILLNYCCKVGKILNSGRNWNPANGPDSKN